MILCICMHCTSCITRFIQFTHQFHMSSWEIEEKRPIEAGFCTLPSPLLGVTYWCRGLVSLGFCQESSGDGIGSWQVCCYQWLIAIVQIGCTCDGLKTDNNLGLVMVGLLTDSRWAGWAGLFCSHSFYPHFCRGLWRWWKWKLQKFYVDPLRSLSLFRTMCSHDVIGDCSNGNLTGKTIIDREWGSF